ncbi:DUF4123 domain-containing protein [Marinobacter sp.]|uniref:DUF4123 domain-containing protein n=1 Tax=Marinobacter sp. TaxID=50741 RepID=UPI00356AB573
MDAANYITTLDGLPLLNEEPSRADYAVIDLGVDERFLKFLYDSDQQGVVHWRSLLENTRWQASWQSGPIFLEFTGSHQVRERLVERMTRLPLGIVIETSESPDRVFGWAQDLLLALAESDERLFRFYDPRSFRPLVATLAERSRRIVRSGATIYWSQCGAWYGCQSPDHAESEDFPRPVSLSQAELTELPRFRLADRAITYARVYREYLPENGDQRIWVFEQLQEAFTLGFESSSLQERWLRLRIRKGAPLSGLKNFREIMNEPAMTPVDRLNAMESVMEFKDVTA